MSDYANARGRWGWMWFDFAAQPFDTLIITFIFAPFFASALAATPTEGQEIWGLTVGWAGVVVALMSPVLGAMADATGPRKPWLALFVGVYFLGAFGLWWGIPGGDVTFVLVALVIGLIGAEFAFVFSSAMLPDLAPPHERGRLSGSAWGFGYVGGVLSLVVMLALFAENDQGVTLIGIAPILGLDPELREGTRAVGPFAAIWMALFAIPLFLWTPDAGRRGPLRGAVQRGLGELASSIRDVMARRGLFWFLLSSMFYRDALRGFYIFGGIYAAGVLGWSIIQIGVFGILAAAVGALGCYVGGRADSAFGSRPVVVACIVILSATALLSVSISRESVLFAVPVAEGSSLPDILFYVAGALIGAAGGCIQAASRTYLTFLADESRMTAAFGLYAIAGRATAWLAPILVSLVTFLSDNQQIGITPILFLFLISWGMILLVPRTGD